MSNLDIVTVKGPYLSKMIPQNIFEEKMAALMPIEECKKHITIIDNRPVVDSVWFWDTMAEALSISMNEYVRLAESTRPDNLVKELASWFNIPGNIKKTKINLKYQEKFKQLLDRIDGKLAELRKTVAQYGQDDMDDVMDLVLQQVGGLQGELDTLWSEYEAEYKQ